MTTLTLPYPPSANRIWRQYKGRTLKSAVYREWLEVTAHVIAHQRPATVAGKYALTIIATRPDKRARDIDNLVKPISDALAQAGVVLNDSLAERVTVGWSQEGPIPGGAILVIVEPWTQQVAA